MTKKSLLTILVLLILNVTFTKCKKEKCKENIDSNCNCTKQYDPVCGCNDKTYGNSCEAECSGITNYKKGACK